MTFIEAQQIISTLAGGVDPGTGEVLPDHSMIGGNARVVRALYMAANALQAVGQQAAPASSRPPVQPQAQSAVQPLGFPAFSAASSDSSQSPAAPARSNRPPMAGKPWSEEEDARLAAAFDAGATVKDLTLSHGRSRGGISSRLVHLGRITEQPGITPRMRGVAAS